MSLILHIPHASAVIPRTYLSNFLISRQTLNEEILRMTDHFTDELFNIDYPFISSIRFPVSRLLVDPERFENDDEESMSKIGMGCIYEKTHDKKPLKEVHCIRDELIKIFYIPHHAKFTSLVENSLKLNNQVLIIDCHSFPKFPLPYELNQEKDRAEICIGADEFHTSSAILDRCVAQFQKLGFTVAVNKPFSGSIVPTKFYNTDRRVQSIMIEVRRDLYMNEMSGEKSLGFVKIQDALKKAVLGIYDG